MFESAETLNIPYARKVLEHLTAHPEEHNQTNFGMRTSCGTTACIAGATILMDADTTVLWDGVGMFGAVTTPTRPGQCVTDRAAELLGLNSYDAGRLFYNMSNVESLDMLTTYIREAEAVQYEGD